MKQTITHEPDARHTGWAEPEVSVANEIVILVACMACAALAVAAVTGRLDALGAKVFSALGL